jgi:mannitol-specific phosphotransferase system IIBC component
MFAINTASFARTNLTNCLCQNAYSYVTTLELQKKEEEEEEKEEKKKEEEEKEEKEKEEEKEEKKEEEKKTGCTNHES